MSFLSSLLPGLRDLRAPLAAGYMWLVFGWLVLRDRVPAEKAATGLVHDVLHTAHNAPSLAVAAAVSVAAYLIGSVSLVVYRLVAGPTIDRAARQAWIVGAMGIRWRVARISRQGWREVPYTAIPLPGLAGRLTYQSRVRLYRLASNEFTKQARTLGSDIERLPKWLRKMVQQPILLDDDVAQHIRRLWREKRPRGFRWVPEDLVLTTQVPAQRLAGKMAGELDDLRTQLVQKDPELFAAYDRLASEAEFREAIFAPLLAIVIAAAAETTWWLLVAFSAALILRIDGRAKARAANAILVHALSARIVESRVAEAFREELQLLFARHSNTKAESMPEEVVSAEEFVSELGVLVSGLGVPSQE